MSPEDINAVVRTVLEFDWQLVVGLGLAVIYLLIGTWFLLKKPPQPEKFEEKDRAVEFYRRWRVPLVGVTFTILGCWAAGGAEKLASGFWSVLFFIALVYVMVKGVRAFRWWFKALPIVGQVYTIKGVGEVEVTEVRGTIPLDSRIEYKTALHKHAAMSTLGFILQTQGTLQEEREAGAVELEKAP